MDAWMVWILLGVVLAAGEMFSLSLYLAPFAAGALLAGIAEAVGAGTAVAFIAFIVSSLLLLGFVRPIARRHLRTPGQLRTGTAALVGKSAVVVERINNDEGCGSVRLDGEVWTARTYDGDEELMEGTRVQVIEIKGATALVSDAG
jgi:membrane protein implicated in regulation of membrane protease activity